MLEGRIQRLRDIDPRLPASVILIVLVSAFIERR